MQSIKITAHMQDGRVATVDPWLPLDSILSAAWMRRNHPEAYYNASSHMLNNDLIIPELPFERREKGDDWYWACSFNMAKPSHEYIMHWHKRFDDHLEQYIDFSGRRGRVDVKSSKFKAYRMPMVIQLFDRLEWFAVGDLPAVLELCREITHIGKKSSQGLGAVDYWTAEPWPEDWSVQRGGELTRAIPNSGALPEGVSGAQMGQYGVRPPYWYSPHQRICFMPENSHGAV